MKFRNLCHSGVTWDKKIEYERVREATSEGMAGVAGGLSEKSANNEPIACIVDVLYTYCTIAKTFPSYSILLVCWLTSTISKRIVTLLANFAVWQCIWKRFIQNFHYRTRVFFCIISREYYTYTTSMPNLYIYIQNGCVPATHPYIRSNTQPKPHNQVREKDENFDNLWLFKLTCVLNNQNQRECMHVCVRCFFPSLCHSATALGLHLAFYD